MDPITKLVRREYEVVSNKAWNLTLTSTEPFMESEKVGTDFMIYLTCATLGTSTQYLHFLKFSTASKKLEFINLGAGSSSSLGLSQLLGLELDL